MHISADIEGIVLVYDAEFGEGFATGGNGLCFQGFQWKALMHLGRYDAFQVFLRGQDVDDGELSFVIDLE